MRLGSIGRGAGAHRSNANINAFKPAKLKKASEQLSSEQKSQIRAKVKPLFENVKAGKMTKPEFKAELQKYIKQLGINIGEKVQTKAEKTPKSRSELELHEGIVRIAQNLGIEIPEGATQEEIQGLISSAINDKKADVSSGFDRVTGNGKARLSQFIQGLPATEIS